MSYSKKILVLKQIEKGFSVNDKEVSAILRLEIESGVATIILSAINFKYVTQGEYCLAVSYGKNKPIIYPLGNKPTGFNTTPIKTPEITDKISAGIFFVSQNVPCLTAFASDGKDKNCITTFKKAVAECYLSRHGEFMNNNEKQADIFSDKKAGGGQNISNFSYDDEAVATENYYDIEEDILDKINKLGDAENELLRDKNVNSDCGCEKIAQKERESDKGFQDETNADKCKIDLQGEPYYFKAKKELDNIFDKFPEEEHLCKIFQDSKWVKINYANDKYYVVGVIKENSSVKYICYGVPARYSENEPEELKGYCSFIPISIFDFKGEGYWMMFQDAITGNSVKKLT